MRRTLIIAEIGVNHNGSLEEALKHIDAAAEAGADVVKFQTFRAEALVSKFAKKAEYQKRTTRATESQLEMIRALELPLSAYPKLIERCRQRSVDFLSTPFDLGSVDFLLDELRLSQIKISSGDITNAPLLLECARNCQSIILSTGMSTLGEIEKALGVLAYAFLHPKEHPSKPTEREFEAAYFSAKGRSLLKTRCFLLHCTTEYPTPPSEVNLRVLRTLRLAFGIRVGLSDHTDGIVVPVAAVALGARVIEKHFTLDNRLPGPDHMASLEPARFEEMVRGIREVEQAMGYGQKVPQSSELKNREVARKSLVAKRSIRKGEKFSEDSVTVKRPGSGISPMRFWEAQGKLAPKDISHDELIEL